MDHLKERILDLEDELARIEGAPATLEEARNKYEAFLDDLTSDAMDAEEDGRKARASLGAEIEELHELIAHLQSYAACPRTGLTDNKPYAHRSAPAGRAQRIMRHRSINRQRRSYCHEDEPSPRPGRHRRRGGRRRSPRAISSASSEMTSTTGRTRRRSPTHVAECVAGKFDFTDAERAEFVAFALANQEGRAGEDD